MIADAVQVALIHVATDIVHRERASGQSDADLVDAARKFLLVQLSVTAPTTKEAVKD